MFLCWGDPQKPETNGCRLGFFGQFSQCKRLSLHVPSLRNSFSLENENLHVLVGAQLLLLFYESLFWLMLLYTGHI